jgi:sugar-specific transcriptional regulator TrmB
MESNKKTVADLVAIGLSEKEAVVYISTLELGRGTVAQISRRAGINRTTGYDILSSLQNKELVRISGKEPKQEYVPESPDNLLKVTKRHLDMLQAQVAKTREASEKADRLIPSLKSLQKTEDRPEVKFYEGVEGMKEVYEDTLSSTEPIRAYASIDDMHATLKGYFPEYYKRRAQKGISIRGIVPETPLGRERMLHNEAEAREAILVPPDTFGFHPEINVYDNKLMMVSWREKLGIIIESAEIADAMKKIYELAWIGAQQVAKGTNS